MNDKLKNAGLKSILIIESSVDETNRFIDVVQSHCDAEVHSFTNSVEAILWLQGNHAQVVMIEEHSQPMNAQEVMDFIDNELPKPIPVFITVNQLPQPGEEGFYYIQKPFTYESLHQLCNLNIECEPKDSLYSLEYLKDVSDGNIEFITGTLELFKTSVNAKLIELDKAEQERNHQRISEIAHAIKPSFEMLLNNEAASLCDKLTYELDPNKVPGQIEELKNIFEEIKEQLESDFSPQ